MIRAKRDFEIRVWMPWHVSIERLLAKDIDSDERTYLLYLINRYIKLDAQQTAILEAMETKYDDRSCDILETLAEKTTTVFENRTSIQSRRTRRIAVKARTAEGK
jgi:hypothetical protein